MVVNPFFLLKIARLKVTVRTVSIHQCKNWFTRSGGFCYDSANNPLASVGNSRNGWGDRWHIAAVTARYANGL
jgi:hypothetical protein